METKTTSPNRAQFERLVSDLKALEAKLRQGGGADRINREHKKGKLTARERIGLLFDQNSPFLETGLLVAYDKYGGQAPAAGVITGFGRIAGREACVMANDATVKAGSWWPETVRKILRIQEITMRCRVPIVYLVDSAGVNLPYQSEVFPGQYGGGRIFFYNSVMRRHLKIPQLAAVMGPCVAGGAYLPALSDLIIMVEGTSFMGLGGPNLVKGAVGQTVDSESLGGARIHNEISGVAHYRAENDETCVQKLREFVTELPPPALPRVQFREPRPPKRPVADIYDLMPAEHKHPYDMRDVLDCLLDEGELDEFQADYAKEMITGYARIEGIPVGIIANQRGLIKSPAGRAPKFGGIIYTDSAEKVAYFIETCNRHETPLLFLQDVSGFMVGTDAEYSGIIRAGAAFVEAMATATVPKIVLTLNHASGAGYYAMAGQGFDPDFIFTWPTGRMGVMEGDSAVMALFSGELDRLKAQGQEPDQKMKAEMERVRAKYDSELDARFAAARGFVDAIITPEQTRPALALALRTALNNPGPHIGIPMLL
ncbi:MAG TPA: acyl-CoA carboxylase subunit beta [Blastocatellia bacterium]|nr:acyl-CoA carboxylase subunit beta [Blastocatellia bacterium]